MPSKSISASNPKLIRQSVDKTKGDPQAWEAVPGFKTLEYLQRLDSYNVGWKSFTEQYLDSTGMFRDADIAILATIAAQEHARLSERVVAGLRRAQREGKTLGRRRIIVDREKIRMMKANGESVRRIAAKTGVSKSLVANILRGA